MALKDNIARFNYFPFLKQLVTRGLAEWETPVNSEKQSLLTRLYIDGDMLLWFPTDDNGQTLEIPAGIQDEHIRKINHDLVSIDVMAGHAGLLMIFITSIIGYLLNPQFWIQQTLIISSIGVVGYLSKKFTRKFIFKIIGAIARMLMKRRK